MLLAFFIYPINNLNTTLTIVTLAVNSIEPIIKYLKYSIIDALASGDSSGVLNIADATFVEDSIILTPNKAIDITDNIAPNTCIIPNTGFTTCMIVFINGDDNALVVAESFFPGLNSSENCFEVISKLISSAYTV